MNKSIRVLIVDDSEDDALIIVLELKRCGYKPIYKRVDTRNDMLEALHSEEWDIVLADYSMPNFSTAEALKIIL